MINKILHDLPDNVNTYQNNWKLSHHLFTSLDRSFDMVSLDNSPSLLAMGVQEIIVGTNETDASL